MWFIADAYADGPSNPFGSTYSQSNIEFSLVCDYTVSGDTRAPVFLSERRERRLAVACPTTRRSTRRSIPATAAFAVTVNQAGVPLVSLGRRQRRRRVADACSNPVIVNDIVTVSYTQPGANAIQDVFGNKCISLAAQPVSNQTQPPPGARIINPAQRVAVARRIDPSDRRVGEGGGL